MRDFLEESDLTEPSAFIESFVKEIMVIPGGHPDSLYRAHAGRQFWPGGSLRRWPLSTHSCLPYTCVHPPGFEPSEGLEPTQTDSNHSRHPISPTLG